MGNVEIPVEKLHGEFARSLRKSCLAIVRDGPGYNIMPVIFLLDVGLPTLRSKIVDLQRPSDEPLRGEDGQRINAIGEIGYRSIAAARDTVTALPGADVSYEAGFALVDEPDGVTHWRISREAVFRVVTETAQDATIEVRPSALCEGNDLRCEHALASWSLALWIRAERALARAAGCPDELGRSVKP